MKPCTNRFETNQTSRQPQLRHNNPQPGRHRASPHDPVAFEETSFPYYGGLRGQVLQLRGQRDGSVDAIVVGQSEHLRSTQPKHRTSDTGLKASTRTSIEASAAETAAAFERDFNKIQWAAARLVAIQEMAKRKGSLSSEDNRIYADSLLELGMAAQNLAKLQQSGQIKDFSMLLQPQVSMPQKQPIQGAAADSDSVVVDGASGAGEQKVEEVTEQPFSEMDLLPPNGENPYEDVADDSVAVTAPKKDASVAEAKPVGLSIAGEGGVASSKPNAVALSGRNGLAVASPKATAIAGVSPEEAAAFSVSLPNRNQLVIKLNDAAAVANSAPPRFSNQYDDYDYNDAVAVLRPASSHDLRIRTHAATQGDSFVNKWKTYIAEDYAGSERSSQPRKRNHLAFRAGGDAFYVY